MRKAYRKTNEFVLTEEVQSSTTEGNNDLALVVATDENTSVHTEVILSRQAAIRLYHQLDNLLFTH